MKSESGFSFAIASQPFEFGFHSCLFFVSLLLFILCVVPTNLVVKSGGGIIFVISSALVSLVLSFLFELSATNLVVKSEGGIVDEAGLELHVAAEPAKEAQHYER